MTYFKNTETFLKVKPNKKYKVDFFLKEEHPDIVRIITPCSCSNGRYNKKENKIEVTYKSGSLNPFKKRIQKTIAVFFSDKSFEKLYINITQDE